MESEEGKGNKKERIIKEAVSFKIPPLLIPNCYLVQSAGLEPARAQCSLDP